MLHKAEISFCTGKNQDAKSYADAELLTDSLSDVIKAV